MIKVHNIIHFTNGMVTLAIDYSTTNAIAGIVNDRPGFNTNAPFDDINLDTYPNSNVNTITEPTLAYRYLYHIKTTDEYKPKEYNYTATAGMYFQTKIGIESHSYYEQNKPVGENKTGGF